MKTASFTKLAGGLIAAAALALQAHANPIVSGDINFIGGVVLGHNGTHPVNMASANQIYSVSAFVSNVPGDESGDYSPAVEGPTDPVTFSTPINFVTLESVSSLTVTPWWHFTSGGKTYSFSILGPVTVLVTPTHLDIDGNGIASITGFTSNDDATFDISIGRTGTSKLTFGNSTSVPGVPDSGSTALMIGLGLAGLGIGMIAQRRKLVKTAE